MFGLWGFLQFFVIESLPLIIVGVCALLMVAVLGMPYVQALAKRARSRGTAFSFPVFSEIWVAARPKLDTLLGVIFSGFFYVYFIVVKTALGIFDCVDTKGGSVLDGNPNVACSRSENPYGTVYPFGIAGMVVYGIGIPLVFGFVFFKYRHQIQADQVSECFYLLSH